MFHCIFLFSNTSFSTLTLLVGCKKSRTSSPQIFFFGRPLETGQTWGINCPVKLVKHKPVVVVVVVVVVAAAAESYYIRLW